MKPLADPGRHVIQTFWSKNVSQYALTLAREHMCDTGSIQREPIDIGSSTTSSFHAAGFFLFECCIFFSCIAERARDMVGQPLEIRKRSETVIECMSFHRQDRNKANKTNNHNTTQHAQNRPVKTRKKGETNRAPLSPSL